MQKTAGALPQFSAGVALVSVDTMPNDCKVLQYGGDTAVDRER